MQKHVTRLELGKALRDLPAMVILEQATCSLIMMRCEQKYDEFMRESCVSTINRSVRSFLAREQMKGALASADG